MAALAGVLLIRRPGRDVVRSPAPLPAREPDFFDSAFSLAAVTRRVREEAALAGRAAAEGRPIAHRLEDLPSRRWIRERVEERMSELRRDLVATTTRLDEERPPLAHRGDGLRPGPVPTPGA